MTLNQQLHQSATHKHGFDPACPVCSVMKKTYDVYLNDVRIGCINGDRWELSPGVTRMVSIWLNNELVGMFHGVQLVEYLAPAPAKTSAEAV